MLYRWFYSGWAYVLQHFTAVCNGGSGQNCSAGVVKTLKPLAYCGAGIKIPSIFNEPRNVYFILSWWKFYFLPKCIFLFGNLFLKKSVLDSQGHCEVAATDLTQSSGASQSGLYFQLQETEVSLGSGSEHRFPLRNSHLTAKWFCTESSSIFHATQNRKDTFCIWTYALMHATVRLMSLVLPDFQAVPPAYSHLRAISPFPCSPASPSPLHIVKYSLPSAIFHHSPSLVSQNFSLPLLAIRSHSPVPTLPPHRTGALAQTARRTYARSLIWRTPPILPRNQGECVCLEGEEMLRISKSWDSLDLGCNRETHLNVKSKKFPWMW